VGLKFFGGDDVVALLGRFRRTLVGLKLVGVVVGEVPEVVSDVPSWG